MKRITILLSAAISLLISWNVSASIYYQGKPAMSPGGDIWVEHVIARDANGKMADFPGKSNGKTFPIYLNNKPWSPKWNGLSTLPTETPCGNLPLERVSIFSAKPTDSTSTKTTVMDRPREKNDFTATIRVENTAPTAGWCEFDIDWE